MRRRRQRYDERRDERDCPGHATPEVRKEPVIPLRPVAAPDGKVALYRDRLSDANIQMNFVLPLPRSPEARKAALFLGRRLGLEGTHVVQMEAMDAAHTAFILAGNYAGEIAMEDALREIPDGIGRYDFDAINKLLASRFDRRIVVVGGLIGTDSQAIGIDTIFTMKGYLGDPGLERYSALRAVNLRAVPDAGTIVRKAAAARADAILVASGGAGPDELMEDLRRFQDEMRSAENVPSHLVRMCHGPRITQALAVELGLDAGFGPGTLPSQVAGFLTTRLMESGLDAGMRGGKTPSPPPP